MWITREVEDVVLRLADHFPAVLITGARQVGKTSLLRRLFPKADYVTLDYPALAEAAATGPETFLSGFSTSVIIDEIQYAPSLLRSIKIRIDEDRTPGRYLLTGSQLFPMMLGISESLAGRCAVVNLHTLSHAEVVASGRAIDESAYLVTGGYPELHVGAEPDFWFPSYVATYLERDIRNVLHVVDLQDYNRFLRVCALRNAQVVNYADMARDTGISPNTARKWLGLLVTSGVVSLVEPYFANRTRRLIKSPKLMFLDSGLASFLAGFSTIQSLVSSRYVGPFWESYVHGEVVRWCASRGLKIPICTWRTVGGREVDLIVEINGESILAIECKWTEKPERRGSPGLRALVASQNNCTVTPCIVCRTRADYLLDDGTRVINTAGLLNLLSEQVLRANA